MVRLIAVVALVWGLLSCQPNLFLPGASTAPDELPQMTRTPGGPDPTIEIPPPIR